MSTINTSKTVSQTLGKVIKQIDKLKNAEGKLDKIASLTGKLEAEVMYQVDSLSVRIASQKAKAKAEKDAAAEAKKKAKAESKKETETVEEEAVVVAKAISDEQTGAAESAIDMAGQDDIVGD